MQDSVEQGCMVQEWSERIDHKAPGQCTLATTASTDPGGCMRELVRTLVLASMGDYCRQVKMASMWLEVELSTVPPEKMCPVKWGCSSCRSNLYTPLYPPQSPWL